jgi:hypothetical protein
VSGHDNTAQQIGNDDNHCIQPGSGAKIEPAVWVGVAVSDFDGIADRLLYQQKKRPYLGVTLQNVPCQVWS